MLMNEPEAGLHYQERALEKQLLFRDGTAGADDAGLRLLVFMAPGNLMTNAPVQFLLAQSDIRVDLLYLVPGRELPHTLPDHDLAMVAVCNSSLTRPLLHCAVPLADQWPRQPVLNDPRRLLGLSRDTVSTVLADIQGICIPTTYRLDTAALRRLADGDISPTGLCADLAYPLVVRPLDSQAGQGLAKLDDASAVADYLGQELAEEYYVARFVDYRSGDGQFRKYRMVLIDGQPYICHMAISDHWMIHYLNAGMRDSVSKRAEEARAFAGFDDGFARRHRAALSSLARHIGLDYVGIDCAETRDGRLLLFEVDTCMIVHAMDSPEVFPYKPIQMRRVFCAFQDMLHRRATEADEDAGRQFHRV